jgi:hypothetical protein
MSTIMLIALVIIFAIVLSLRRSRRRGPHVTEVTRTVTREKKDGADA